MRTTAEQRATMRAALADETYADLNRDEVRDVLALLDDLDEALAELAALRYGLDGAMECILRVRQAMAEKVGDDVVLAVRRVVAERDALRAVADAARGVAEYAHELDCATLEHDLDGEGAYARHWVPCDCAVATLRAALARLDEVTRG